MEKGFGGTGKIRGLQELWIYFVCYSVIGWLYEVFLEVVVYRWGFSNRGVLTGPYCVVYGFGAILLLLLLGRLMKRRIPAGQVSVTPVLIFLLIILITTAVELAASYIMEWSVGHWQWDYSRFAMNFRGRIAPNPSIRFGFGGMIFLYVLQPLFEKMTGKLSDVKLSVVSGCLLLLFFIDVAVTFLF